MPQMQEHIVTDAARAATDARSRPDAPLVSVVIPTCNRAALVRRAIESVMRQSYTNLEIIVVDDASSDGTGEMVRSLADPRIRYLRHEERRGGSAARNTGIRAATGEFIAFLDDDDEWEPHKTEEHLRALAGYDAVLCTLRIEDKVKSYGPRRTVSLDDLRRGDFPAGGTGALMARAELVKSVMFDETLPRYQDWDIFIRIAQRTTIGYLDRPLVRYNEGAHPRLTNRIARMSPEELERHVRMLDKHRDFFGTAWYTRHMCSVMLYGLRHRPGRMKHLRYVLRRYGYRAVGWALWRRLRQFAA